VLAAAVNRRLEEESMISKAEASKMSSRPSIRSSMSGKNSKKKPSKKKDKLLEHLNTIVEKLSQQLNELKQRQTLELSRVESKAEQTA
jgi:hypothetical protein